MYGHPLVPALYPLRNDCYLRPFVGRVMAVVVGAGARRPGAVALACGQAVPGPRTVIRRGPVAR